MYPLLRQLLFLLPPEQSHRVTLATIELAEHLRLSKLFVKPPVVAPVQFLGLTFPNRVGLAAGLDKNADHIDALAALGFGFIEVGTVTPRPQHGNPRPRLFRLPSAQGIINRMGFNNLGVDHMVERLQAQRWKGIVGVNIGKNKETPAEQAIDDYLFCLRKVYPLASYVAVNISSPNTPGLRDLQFGSTFTELLEQLKNEQQRLATEHQKQIPLLVKIAPDMREDEITSVAQQLLDYQIDGVIATNSTVDHHTVAQLPHGNEKGGLSGAPLQVASTRVIRLLAERLNGQIPIIGVGGIINANDAAEKIAAGASLVQLYSGLIYRGPALIREVAQRIAQGEVMGQK